MSERRIAIPYNPWPIYKVTSRIRLEKPYSLSYHDNTLTKLVSITLVNAGRRWTNMGCRRNRQRPIPLFTAIAFPTRRKKTFFILSHQLFTVKGKARHERLLYEVGLLLWIDSLLFLHILL